MKKSSIVIIVIIVVSACVALFSFKGLLTPYVPFEEAKSGSAYVQVIGNLVKSIPVVNTPEGFAFYIEDEHSQRLHIVHRGSKPLNFEHATSVVAIGRFNKDTHIFEADKILVKCPSKYTRENK